MGLGQCIDWKLFTYIGFWTSYFLKKNVRLCRYTLYLPQIHPILRAEDKCYTTKHFPNGISLPLTKKIKNWTSFFLKTQLSLEYMDVTDRLLELNYYFCANTFHYNVAFPKDKKDWELRFLLMNRTQQSLFLSGFKKHQLSRVKLPAQHSGQLARWDEDLGSQYHLPRGVIHRLQQVKMLRKATVDRARNGQQ